MTVEWQLVSDKLSVDQADAVFHEGYTRSILHPGNTVTWSAQNDDAELRLIKTWLNSIGVKSQLQSRVVTTTPWEVVE
jgi:hypothetical protein